MYDILPISTLREKLLSLTIPSIRLRMKHLRIATRRRPYWGLMSKHITSVLTSLHLDTMKPNTRIDSILLLTDFSVLLHSDISIQGSRVDAMMRRITCTSGCICDC